MDRHIDPIWEMGNVGLKDVALGDDCVVLVPARAFEGTAELAHAARSVDAAKVELS